MNTENKKKGRPVVTDSARQARLAAQAARKEANGGVIGSWQDFDLWVAPVNDTETPSLWRYDIYRSNDTKSVRSGVARSMFDARKFCMRSVYSLSQIYLTN